MRFIKEVSSIDKRPSRDLRLSLLRLFLSRLFLFLVRDLRLLRSLLSFEGLDCGDPFDDSLALEDLDVPLPFEDLDDFLSSDNLDDGPSTHSSAPSPINLSPGSNKVASGLQSSMMSL